MNNNYGIAIDIGTTTLVGELWDTDDNKSQGTLTTLNPQRKYGTDTISRITYCNRNGGIEELQASIIEGINDIIGELLEKYGRIGSNPSEVSELAVVGNPTMMHILMGYNPASLSIAPYEGTFRGDMEIPARDIGILAGEDGGATVYVAPAIAGQIGSDITAGIITTGLAEGSSNRLFIDIGTNGEIVLNSHGKLVACSTAAGPAFEGRGILGSEIVDIVAEMLSSGDMDSTGRLLTATPYSKGSFTITQKYIREIQLAKAAIAAGIIILCRSQSIKLDDLNDVMVAGSFGNHLNISNAIAIGLIPEVDSSIVTFVGNSALEGTSELLLSKQCRKEVDSIINTVDHIELSNEEDFQDIFIGNINF